MEIKEQLYCRICKGKIEEVLNLGSIFPSGFVLEQPTEAEKVPLVLSRCTDCGLIQLKHTVNLDLMYRQYWYSSSLNKSMVSSLKEIVCEIEERVSLKEGDIVVDIGCNDGTMLEMYSQPGILRVGFDPSLNLQRKQFPLFLFCNDYFTYKAYHEGMGDGRGAKVVTAIAMFYDLPDPNSFVEDVKHILRDDGIFVIQFTDLLSMYKSTAFDNICHEHLEYYRLHDVIGLLEKHNFDVIDVSYNDVNGGSIRVTACHAGRYKVDPSVSESLEKETEFLNNYSVEDFNKAVSGIKFKVSEFLKWVSSHSHRVYALGASTKGATLLQVCGVTEKQVPFAAEVNKDKFGLRTVGSNIEIISETDAFIKHPDYFIVPIWHFKKNLLANKHVISYLESNGKLVFPLPYFHIVTKDGEFRI